MSIPQTLPACVWCHSPISPSDKVQVHSSRLPNGSIEQHVNHASCALEQIATLPFTTHSICPRAGCGITTDASAETVDGASLRSFPAQATESIVPHASVPSLESPIPKGEGSLVIKYEDAPRAEQLNRDTIQDQRISEAACCILFGIIFMVIGVILLGLGLGGLMDTGSLAWALSTALTLWTGFVLLSQLNHI